MATYSQEFKESLVSKVLNNPTQSMSEIARQSQISVSTLHTWVQKAKQRTEPTESTKDAVSWTPERRFQALLETANLSGDNINQYCRQQGLYKQQLEQWRKEFMSQPSEDKNQKQQLSELKRLREENKQLQRDLRRKEKALAETSALLVLKKKADLIWPVDEED